MSFATVASHFLGGAIAAFSTRAFPLFSVIFVIMFLVYEFDEQWHLNDESFEDIREFLAGMFFGGLSLYILVPA